MSFYAPTPITNESMLFLCRYCGEIGHYVTSCALRKKGLPPVREWDAPRVAPQQSPSSPQLVRRSTRQPKSAAKYVPSIGGGGGAEGSEKHSAMENVPPTQFSPATVVAELGDPSDDFDPFRLCGPFARVLGRKRGAVRLSGVGYKGGTSCGSFRFLWRHRVGHARTVAELMLRLRILVAAIKWDDMEPPEPELQEKEPVYTITQHRKSGFRWWYVAFDVAVVAHLIPASQRVGKCSLSCSRDARYSVRVEGLLDDGTSGIQEEWMLESDIEQLYAVASYRNIVDQQEARQVAHRREMVEQGQRRQLECV